MAEKLERHRVEFADIFGAYPEILKSKLHQTSTLGQEITSKRCDLDITRGELFNYFKVCRSITAFLLYESSSNIAFLIVNLSSGNKVGKFLFNVTEITYFKDSGGINITTFPYSNESPLSDDSNFLTWYRDMYSRGLTKRRSSNMYDELNDIMLLFLQFHHRDISDSDVKSLLKNIFFDVKTLTEILAKRYSCNNYIQDYVVVERMKSFTYWYKLLNGIHPFFSAIYSIYNAISLNLDTLNIIIPENKLYMINSSPEREIIEPSILDDITVRSREITERIIDKIQHFKMENLVYIDDRIISEYIRKMDILNYQVSGDMLIISGDLYIRLQAYNTTLFSTMGYGTRTHNVNNVSNNILTYDVPVTIGELLDDNDIGIDRFIGIVDVTTLLKFLVNKENNQEFIKDIVKSQFIKWYNLLHKISTVTMRIIYLVYNIEILNIKSHYISNEGTESIRYSIEDLLDMNDRSRDEILTLMTSSILTSIDNMI